MPGFQFFPHAAPLSIVRHGFDEGGCDPRLFHPLGFVGTRVFLW